MEAERHRRRVAHLNGMAIQCVRYCTARKTLRSRCHGTEDTVPPDRKRKVQKLISMNKQRHAIDAVFLTFVHLSSSSKNSTDKRYQADLPDKLAEVPNHNKTHEKRDIQKRACSIIRSLDRKRGVVVILIWA